MTHDAQQRCRCVARHRPEPLELHRHHVHPLGMGGRDEPGNVVWLCPTAHTSVHEVLATMLRAAQPYSWGMALRRWPGLNRVVHQVALAGYQAVVNQAARDAAIADRVATAWHVGQPNEAADA